MLALLLALATSTAHAEPLNTLRDPYGHCDQQTLDTAMALERAGDREALRDHVRSYGCKLIWPREAFDLFEVTLPSDGDRAPRAMRRPAGRR